ncbi:MAG: type II toxin-antitoxin system VapC family toxin [Acidobacteriia bacterium]|nr:type II toxin-antitoxin system VapC family toxin [Terriglobia bacterium]
MVIDTSALIAILQQEPEAGPYARAIGSDPVRLVSSVSALETAIVIESRKGPSGGRDFDLLLHEARAEVVPFTVEQFEIARGAYRKFGKGRHPAALNFGDCCTYALAKVSGEALLAKGNDFPRTDIQLTGIGAE